MNFIYETAKKWHNDKQNGSPTVSMYGVQEVQAGRTKGRLTSSHWSSIIKESSLTTEFN